MVFVYRSFRIGWMIYLSFTDNIMPKKPLTKDSEFTVGEEKILVYILSGLFLALFLYGLVDSLSKGFKNLDYSSMVYVIALSLSFMFFSKGRSKRVFIRINKNGIYQDEKLVTSWPGFIKAYVTQDKKVFTVQDNFVLMVEYERENKGLKRKIPLGNTQNKSEEDIIAAIKFFSQ